MPADLDALVLRCLAKDAAQRPESATALAEALRACEAAGRWSAVDAERWWAPIESAGAAEPALPARNEPARLTVCAVDLKRRLAQR